MNLNKKPSPEPDSMKISLTSRLKHQSWKNRKQEVGVKEQRAEIAKLFSQEISLFGYEF